MLPEQNFEGMFSVLHERGVRFVLIGGLAAIINGSPFATEGVDVTPEHTESNLTRLSAALTELEAKIATREVPEGVPFSHNALSLAGSAVWNLVTKFGRLDIAFVPNGTEGFDDLRRDATDVEIAGIQIAVASLADIIRSKQAANRPKDQRVLPTLREILAARNPRNQGNQTNQR
ncbi:MAG: hypothetical protein LH471_03450 [Salinibacterium sp.]|nr:hypothetical protein [Salinibacterium sp.]